MLSLKQNHRASLPVPVKRHLFVVGACKPSLEGAKFPVKNNLWSPDTITSSLKGPRKE